MDIPALKGLDDARSTDHHDRLPGMGHAFRYRPPKALQDLHVLDMLELSGSQAKASEALAIHQSSVSRSLQLMRQQFSLQPPLEPAVCRHGSNASLHHLRLSYRAHRLMAGAMRIGTDALHQHLLGRWDCLQPVPPRFRSVHHWADLLHHALIDGALVSSAGHASRQSRGLIPAVRGLVSVPLGRLPLRLLGFCEKPRGVLMHGGAIAPELHQALQWRGVRVQQRPDSCQEMGALLELIDRLELALPVCPAMAVHHWKGRDAAVVQELDPPLYEHLWLLLPRELLQLQGVVRRCVWCLRRRIRSLAGGVVASKAQGLQL